eukprot:763248-Hanusia_phi.AAC.1
MRRLCVRESQNGETGVMNDSSHEITDLEAIQVTEMKERGTEEDSALWPEDVCSLPPGWEVRVSRSTLKHFYVHVPTGTRTNIVPLTQPLTPEISRTEEELSETLIADHSQGKYGRSLQEEEESLSQRRHPDPAALLDLQSTGQA